MNSSMDIGDFKRAFGAAVKVHRNRLGISQEELAERANLHRTYICDVEGGGRNVSLENIQSIARALGIPVTALFSSSEFGGSAADRIVDILLVEDNPDDAELMMAALQKAWIANRIHVVKDGAAALEFLFGRGEYAFRQLHEPPQLVLLDLNLPKISGLQVLRQIKSHPNTRHVAVVILTASRGERDFATSKQLGADAYLIKPVDFRNLSRVTPQLKLHWALLKRAHTERRGAGAAIGG